MPPYEAGASTSIFADGRPLPSKESVIIAGRKLADNRAGRSPATYGRPRCTATGKNSQVTAGARVKWPARALACFPSTTPLGFLGYDRQRHKMPARGRGPSVTKRQPMTLTEFLILLLVAGICGAIGQSIAGYSHGGCLSAIALGFIGALLGTWLARLAGLPEMFALAIGNQNFPIIWSIIGAALFVAVLSLLTSRRGLPP